MTCYVEAALLLHVTCYMAHLYAQQLGFEPWGVVDVLARTDVVACCAMSAARCSVVATGMLPVQKVLCSCLHPSEHAACSPFSMHATRLCHGCKARHASATCTDWVCLNIMGAWQMIAVIKASML
jgi:hypothetical protein